MKSQPLKPQDLSSLQFVRPCWKNLRAAAACALYSSVPAPLPVNLLKSGYTSHILCSLQCALIALRQGQWCLGDMSNMKGCCDSPSGDRAGEATPPADAAGLLCAAGRAFVGVMTGAARETGPSPAPGPPGPPRPAFCGGPVCPAGPAHSGPGQAGACRSCLAAGWPSAACCRCRHVPCGCTASAASVQAATASRRPSTHAFRMHACLCMCIGLRA